MQPQLYQHHYILITGVALLILGSGTGLLWLGSKNNDESWMALGMMVTVAAIIVIARLIKELLVGYII